MAKNAQTTANKKTDSPATALVDIAECGKELPAWKLAGICAMQGWREGKKVIMEEFEAAVSAFEKRRCGGR